MNKKRRDFLICLLFAIPVAIYTVATNTGVAGTGVYLLRLLVLAPIWEEIFFRGIIQHLLTRFFSTKKIEYAGYLAIIIASVLFTVPHILFNGNMLSALVFFPGVVMGWHYYKHGDIRYCIALHCLYNASVVNWGQVL